MTHLVQFIVTMSVRADDSTEAENATRELLESLPLVDGVTAVSIDLIQCETMDARA